MMRQKSKYPAQGGTTHKQRGGFPFRSGAGGTLLAGKAQPRAVQTVANNESYQSFEKLPELLRPYPLRPRNPDNTEELPLCFVRPAQPIVGTLGKIYIVLCLCT